MYNYSHFVIISEPGWVVEKALGLHSARLNKTLLLLYYYYYYYYYYYFLPCFGVQWLYEFWTMWRCNYSKVNVFTSLTEDRKTWGRARKIVWARVERVILKYWVNLTVPYTNISTLLTTNRQCTDCKGYHHHHHQSSAQGQVLHCKLRQQFYPKAGLPLHTQEPRLQFYKGWIGVVASCCFPHLTLSLASEKTLKDLKRSQGTNEEVRRVDLANWALRNSPKFNTGVKYQFHKGFWPDQRSGNPNHPSPP